MPYLSLTSSQPDGTAVSYCLSWSFRSFLIGSVPPDYEPTRAATSAPSFAVRFNLFPIFLLCFAAFPSVFRSIEALRLRELAALIFSGEHALQAN
jgi:hypothetical protein